MFSPWLILSLIVVYVVILLMVAVWGENKNTLGFKLSSSPIVYALSITVYCTTWTFYGSVGKAVSSGFAYLSVYLGPTLMCLFFWPILIKMTRLKNQYRFTSIADFISVRYGNSHFLATVITLLLMVGLLPYIALQFKALVSTAVVLSEGAKADYEHIIGLTFLILMIVFTIMFGVRRLDPTERHQGMMLVLAVEGLLKLFTLLGVGGLVVYGMFNGVGDLFETAQRAMASNELIKDMANAPNTAPWFTLIFISAFVFILLPRQFHVMVVENSNERQITSAQWLVPLYLLLINIFMIPIALAGTIIGVPAAEADTYVLKLPMLTEYPGVAVLVFMGGFSAAIGMIIISAMTMSTMITNHVVLPVIEATTLLKGLRRYLLPCRWVVVSLFLFSGYLIYRLLTQANISLVYIGIISFVAILQLAPSAILGLFWKEGNKAGAVTGLSLGYTFWAYCLVIPALVKIGVLNQSISKGLFGIELLQPERLFGLELDLVSHAVFWSLGLNVVGYILGSLVYTPTRDEQNHAASFVDIKTEDDEENLEFDQDISLQQKSAIMLNVLERYFASEEAAQKMQLCLERCRLDDRKSIHIMELVKIKKELARILSGAIGSASANSALDDSDLITESDKKRIDQAYADLLNNLQITPEELKRKVNFYKEKEKLIMENNKALKASLDKVTEEVKTRVSAEKKLRESEEKYRKLIENISSEYFFYQHDETGVFTYVSPSVKEVLGYDPEDFLQHYSKILTENPINERVNEYTEATLTERKSQTYEVEVHRKPAGTCYLEVSETGAVDSAGHSIVEGIAHDVTARRRAETALKNLNAELEDRVESRTSELKSAYDSLQYTLNTLKETQRQLIEIEKMASLGNLVAGVAHEINTPLGVGITSCTYLKQQLDEFEQAYQNGKLTRDQFEMSIEGFKEGLELIHKPLLQSAKLIKDFKKVAVDSTSEEQSNFDVLQWLTDLMYSQKKKLESHQCTITINCPSGITVTSFQESLSIVFINLIENSLSHGLILSKNKKINISVMQDDENIRVIYQDNGVGIAESKIEKIFEPFFTTARSQGSTGLGLHIVYNIVSQKLHGKIEVRNIQSVGVEGVEFEITLPKDLPIDSDSDLIDSQRIA